VCWSAGELAENSIYGVSFTHVRLDNVPQKAEATASSTTYSTNDRHLANAAQPLW
jgi:hypothetical protein